MVWLLLAAWLLVACGDPRQALAPPDADVTGIQTVLVFSFANDTAERELGAAVTAGLVQRLGETGWYDVLAPRRAADYIDDERLDPFDMDYDSPQWNETARDIAIALNADGFILGVVTGYRESVVASEPHLHREAGDVQWLVDQTTGATITVRGKLINVHTGDTVYERNVTGSGEIADSRLLNWIIPEPPPEAVLPAPHRRDVAAAKDAAVSDALDKLTRDILPRPVDQSKDEQADHR